jgi:hypothetical protein
MYVLRLVCAAAALSLSLSVALPTAALADNDPNGNATPRSWAREVVASFVSCCLSSGSTDNMLELMTPALRKRYTGSSGGCTLTFSMYEYTSFELTDTTVAPDGREVIVDGALTGEKYRGHFRIHVEQDPESHHWRVSFLSFEHAPVDAKKDKK